MTGSAHQGLIGVAISTVFGLALAPGPAEAQVDPTLYLVPGSECTTCPKDEVQELTESLARAAQVVDSSSIAITAGQIIRREHQDNEWTFVRRGCSKYAGSKSIKRPPPVVPGPIRADCFSLMLNVVLPDAFAAQGRSDEWQAIRHRANEISTEMGADGVVGVALMRAFQERLGWKGIFWAPDAERADRAHGNIATRVAEAGSFYGLETDNSKLVLDYTGGGDTTNLQRLRRLPFAILAARSGDHMAILADGMVYEVHRDYGCDRPDVLEATRIEDWHWWSGAIVAPADDVERAWQFQPPTLSGVPWLTQ